MNMTTATIFENISKAGSVSQTTLNGLPGMSSLEIAEATGKRHDHVLRGIKKMLKEVAPLLGRAIQYVETSYQDSQNKTQPLIILDKELTFTVLTGYNATLRLLVNRRWLELEGSGFERVSVQAAMVHLIEHDRCDWKALKVPHKNTQKGLKAAVAKGNLTPQKAVELGLKAVDDTMLSAIAMHNASQARKGLRIPT